MKNNTYYWIHTKGITHEYIPMHRNHQGSWCFDTQSTRVFISDYKLELLHGKGCILREVDFEKDVEDFKSVDPLEFTYFCDEDYLVMFGNDIFLWYSAANKIVKNPLKGCKVLKYKETSND